MEKIEARKAKIAIEADKLRKESETRELTPREQQIIKEDEANKKAEKFAGGCTVAFIILFLIVMIFLAVKCVG